MTRLRILVVSSDTYPPTRVDVTVLFGVELANRGHEIDWILQSETACARAYVTEWGGGRVWVGATDLGDSLFRRLRKHALGIANDCRLFARLRQTRYDAVQVKDKFVAGLFAVAASRLFRTRFIYWLSYPFPEHYLLRAKDGAARYPVLYHLRGLAYKWLLYRCLLRAADHVFVQSEQMRQDVAAEGIPLDKMTVIPMGIDVGMFAAADGYQQRRVLPPGVPCVLYLGTLARVRRLDFLIRAFAMVRAAVPTAQLYIVGRGDDPQDQVFLENEVSRLDLQSSVVFVGQLPQADALNYVREADVCASPFYPTPVLRSTSPTKLIEYMAMAKAVVANDHPEQMRVIEASGAGYCVAYEEQAFAAAIVRLLQNPETAQLMGQRGRRYAIEHRDYKTIADIVEKQLLTVVEGRC
ncbi:MAG: glycosyltransferase family 4 protein [Steroidobacteraceae bacterium]|jgi:glycosyltransferase involved in cell wall biosynthesis